MSELAETTKKVDEFAAERKTLEMLRAAPKNYTLYWPLQNGGAFKAEISGRWNEDDCDDIEALMQRMMKTIRKSSEEQS